MCKICFEVFEDTDTDKLGDFFSETIKEMVGK